VKTVKNKRPGKIYTFYSYKGGTGRSMAVANFAHWLVRQSPPPQGRVLLMDWDLEAPGLHRYFPDTADVAENVERPGIINYFWQIRERLESDPAVSALLAGDESGAAFGREFPLDDYLVRDIAPGVDLVKAGRLDADYARLVSAFDWVKFYDSHAGVFPALRRWLASEYEYCLIDSRTGFNDISGVCTMLLPEKLVTVFTANRQNLSGVLDLSARAVDYRRASEDFRPLAVFPLPSRIENAENDLKQKWRKRYQEEFEATLQKIYQLDGCEMTAYFNEVQLPHVSFYAYGEEVALVREEHSDTLSLSHAYENFFRKLTALEFAWDDPAEVVATEEAGTVVVPDPYPPASATGHDIYISYAHIDNQTYGDQKGWVDSFHNILELRLAQLLGVRVRVRRDTKLSGNDEFGAALAHQFNRGTIFIPILSPRYVSSEWARKEMELFFQQAESDAGVFAARKRVFPVVKTFVPRERFPEELKKDYPGYTFYEHDAQSERPREFGYVPGSDGDKKFLSKVDDLAWDIYNLLSERDADAAAGAEDLPAGGESVYLAETTSDLVAARDKIKRELLQYGYRVLPGRELPPEAAALKAAAREDLSRSRLSVHLMGENYGLIPEGEEERSVIHLQADLAAERSAADPSFARIIWTPVGLTPPGRRQAEFLSRLEANLGPGSDFLRTGLEDLKTVILERLEARPPPPPQSTHDLKLIYFMCDSRDFADLRPIMEFLFGQGFETLPSATDGEPAEIAQYHRESLLACDAALIYYGSANQLWLHSKLLDLRRAAGWGRVKSMPAAVYVAGSWTDEKRLFRTREAMVIDGTDGRPVGEALEPFIAQIWAGGAA
jgi:MinD-like ATPase involved in chromosome partitioning or flagellar assembly